MELWASDDPAAWRDALARYESVVAVQGSARLPALDRWYRLELPGLIAARTPPRVAHEELVRLTEWKMARGVWRARNLALVRANPPELVEQTSQAALARIPDPLAPITLLSKLGGVGPATASAVASAAAPAVYPFFDELVGAQVPDLGKLDFNLRYYARYAEALRERAARLGPDWSATLVERALWANAGGKVGAAAGGQEVGPALG